ncbi:MAG: Bacterial membrane protein YfhO [Parcubacteria group bacterium Gr01-1014_38]|nr:MAG: Bacterial membrane protein YfhO [Parcubacteria group bacterium Gr01-1014_38]
MNRAWDLLVLALVAVALLTPYTVSSFLLAGDIRDLYLPIEDFFRAEMAEGRVPSWDPDTALGFPVLASAQTGFWYPPLFLLRPFLPPEYLYAVTYLLHGLVLALGMYSYARSLGLSRAGSMLTALACTGSGFTVGHFTHANIVFGIAWLPWVLLVSDALAASLRPRLLVLLSILLALTALPGHFHIAAIIAALSACRFLFQLRVRQPGVPASHTFWTFGALFLPVLVGMLALTAAQLFPTLELVRESTRGPGGGFDLARANQHSFPPWQAITFFLPAFFGFPDLSEYWGTRPQIEMAAWIGTLPFLFALVGIGSLRARTRERVSPNFWVILALVGFLFALGRWSPLRLLGLEPTLGIFSSPARYLVLTQWSLALLAGIGFDRVQRQQRAGRLSGLFGIGAALAVGGGFVLLKTAPDTLRRLGALAIEQVILGKPGHVLSKTQYLEKLDYLLERVGTWGFNLKNPLILLSTVLLLFGGIWLVRSARRPRNAAPSPRSLLLRASLVLGATAVELLAMAWQAHPRVAWADVRKESPVTQVIRDRPRGRLYVVHPQGDTGLYFANPTTINREEHERLLRDLAVANIFTRSGIPGIEWTASLDLARASHILSRARDDQGRPVNENLLDRLGVRYVAGSTRTPALHLPLPARGILNFESAEQATVRVWERPTARPRVELLTAMPQEITEPLPPTAGTATIVSENPHHLAIRAENRTGHPAALVLRDSFYPGWQATLDGVSVPIARAESVFRGVLIPPGTHTLMFRYQPRALYAGIVVSSIVLMALGGMLLRPALLRSTNGAAHA